jgi:hypothetical protein
MKNLAGWTDRAAVPASRSPAILAAPPIGRDGVVG